MRTISITENNALKAYNGADASGQKLLMDLFGKDQLKVNIMDRMNSFEDACAIKGVNPDDIIPFKNPKNDYQRGQNASGMLDLMIDVANEGWVANYDDKKEKKWEPIFEKITGGGFGFSITFYVFWHTNAGAGSRRVFKDSDLCKAFAIKFSDIYNIYLTKEKSFEF